VACPLSGSPGVSTKKPLLGQYRFQRTSDIAKLTQAFCFRDSIKKANCFSSNLLASKMLASNRLASLFPLQAATQRHSNRPIEVAHITMAASNPQAPCYSNSTLSVHALTHGKYQKRRCTRAPSIIIQRLAATLSAPLNGAQLKY